MLTIVIATFTAGSTRHLLEIGMALAAIGGGSVLLAGASGLHRVLLSLGGLLIAAAGVLAVIAVHWGVTPWAR